MFIVTELNTTVKGLHQGDSSWECQVRTFSVVQPKKIMRNIKSWSLNMCETLGVWDSDVSVSWSFVTSAWIGGRGGHTSTCNTTNTQNSEVHFIRIIIHLFQHIWYFFGNKNWLKVKNSRKMLNSNKQMVWALK